MRATLCLLIPMLVVNPTQATAQQRKVAPAGARTAAPSADLSDVRQEITKRHDEAVKRLQDWIALPSIAAEDRGFPAGAEHMATLLRDAGFQQVNVIATDGKPGVFATLDAGGAKTV